MIAGKQKKKLQDLLLKSGGIEQQNVDSLSQLQDILKEYTIILRKLHEKEPNIFTKFYKYDLKEIKKQVQITQEEQYRPTQLKNLAIAKELLERSIDSAITYLTDYASI